MRLGSECQHGRSPWGADSMEATFPCTSPWFHGCLLCKGVHGPAVHLSAVSPLVPQSSGSRLDLHNVPLHYVIPRLFQRFLFVFYCAHIMVHCLKGLDPHESREVSVILSILNTTTIHGTRDFDSFQPEPTKKTRLAYDSGFCSLEPRRRLSSRQCPNTSPPERL